MDTMSKRIAEWAAREAAKEARQAEEDAWEWLQDLDTEEDDNE